MTDKKKDPTVTVADEAAADDPDSWYSTSKVAALLGYSTQTIADWIHDGKIKATKVERNWRIPRSEVLRIMQEAHG